MRPFPAPPSTGNLIGDQCIRRALLDEITIARRHDRLDMIGVVGFLTAEKPDMTHVLLTGRNAPPALTGVAGLVPGMTVVKHPFWQGIKAQAGIEF